jgi:hypothetical protein
MHIAAHTVIANTFNRRNNPGDLVRAIMIIRRHEECSLKEARDFLDSLPETFPVIQVRRADEWWNLWREEQNLWLSIMGDATYQLHECELQHVFLRSISMPPSCPDCNDRGCPICRPQDPPPPPPPTPIIRK